MPISQATFSDLSGAAADLFAGMGEKTNGSLKAMGLNITAEGTLMSAQGTRIGAEGTRIGAEGTSITAAGQRLGAKGTLIGAEETNISASGLRIKAQGDLAEAENYDLAAALARKNVAYTQQSTAIGEMQLDRKITQTIGGQRADVAGAGLKESGSAIYLLADSASQGALAKDVLARQGAITEAGYEEQAKSYETMSAAARMAFAGEMDIAARTDVVAQRQRDIAAGQEDIAARTEGIATRQLGIADRQEGLARTQEYIASQQQILAQKTQEAGDKAAKTDWISVALKGTAAVASLFPGYGTAIAAAATVGDTVYEGQKGEHEPAGPPEQA